MVCASAEHSTAVELLGIVGISWLLLAVELLGVVVHAACMHGWFADSPGGLSQGAGIPCQYIMHIPVCCR